MPIEVSGNGQLQPGRVVAGQPHFSTIRGARYDYGNGEFVTGIAAMQEMAMDPRYGTPLPPEAGELMDDILIRDGDTRLILAADIIAEGLTKLLPNWWGVLSIQYRRMGKFGRARVSMLPGGRGENARPDEDAVSSPVYTIEEDFEFHERLLAASENAGAALDMESLLQGFRNYKETLEDVAFNGIGFTVPGTVTYGLLTAPNANTLTWSGGAWDDVATTGEEIYNDVLALRDLLYADNKYGPFNLYIEKDYESPLDKLYSDGTTTQPVTVRKMIEGIQAGGRGIRIRISDQMPADRGALVNMQNETVDMVQGQEATWVPYPVNRYMHEFGVLGCQVVRFKDSNDGTSGVAIGNV